MLSENFGVPVDMYDCTDKRAPTCPAQTQRCLIRFNYVCLGPPLSFLSDREFKPLDEAINTLQSDRSDKDLILKIDCEGCEWPVLDSTPDYLLTQFRTIVIEFHFLEKAESHGLYLRVMQKLLKNFLMIHTQGCNC